MELYNTAKKNLTYFVTVPKHKVLSENDLATTYDTLGISEWGKEDIKVWEEYKKAAGDASMSMSDFQNVQDKLATSFVNNGNYLANLTEETKKSTIAFLEEMGVRNAEEVVTQALADKEYALGLKKEFTKETSIKLKDVTVEEINKFASEKENANLVADALIRLALQKQLVNGTTLDFSADMSNLASYVEALGYTATALRGLDEYKKLGGGKDYVTGMPSNVYNKSGEGKRSTALEKNAQNEINKALSNKIKTLKTSKGNKSNDPTKSSGNSGKGSGGSGSLGVTGTVNKSTKEEINWMERAFDVISQKIDLLKVKFENLFDIDLKANNINQQVKKVTQDLNTTSQAIDLYTKKYTALGKKKVKVTVDSKIVKGKNGKKTKKPKTKKMSIKKYLNKAKNGDNSIQKVYGEQADLISQYEEYYDLVTEMRQKQQEDISSLYDLEMQKLSAVTEYYDAYIGRLDAANGAITAAIDLQSRINKMRGGTEAGNISDYRANVSNRSKAVAKAREEYSAYQAQQTKAKNQLDDTYQATRKKYNKNLSKQVKQYKKSKGKKGISAKEKKERLAEFDNGFKQSQKKLQIETETELTNLQAAWIHAMGEMLDASEELAKLPLAEFESAVANLDKELNAIQSTLGRTSEASFRSMEGVNAYNNALQAENNNRWNAYQEARNTLSEIKNNIGLYSQQLSIAGIDPSTIKSYEDLGKISNTATAEIASNYLAACGTVEEATDSLSDTLNDYFDTVHENSIKMLDNIQAHFDTIADDIEHRMSVNSALLDSANSLAQKEELIINNLQEDTNSSQNLSDEKTKLTDNITELLAYAVHQIVYYDNEGWQVRNGGWYTPGIDEFATNEAAFALMKQLGLLDDNGYLQSKTLNADEQKTLQDALNKAWGSGTVGQYEYEMITKLIDTLGRMSDINKEIELSEAEMQAKRNQAYQEIFNARNEEYTRQFDESTGVTTVELTEDSIERMNAAGTRIKASSYEQESQAYAQQAQDAKNIGDALWDYINQKVQEDSAFLNSSEYFDMVDQANEWYDKSSEAEISSIDMHHKYWQTNVENFNRSWDDLIAGIERTINSMDKNISLLETKGHFITAQFYNDMSGVYEEQLEQEEKHNSELKKLLDDSVKSGDIKKYDEEWYDLMNQIYDSDDAILDLNQSLADMAKNAREADRELREQRTQAIDNLIAEASFYQNLASGRTQFDKDHGAITEHGIANFALGFNQIDSETAKVKEYQGSLARLEEQYANNEIGAKEYYEYFDQYNEGIQSSISNIQSLKDTLKSLVEEGLNAQLDALKELCEQYKDTLSEAKNLRDYQNTIEEQTKTKESLQRQLAVVQQMNTEEGRSKAQSLLVQLDEANKALEDTEYDKYISDQENLIDEFQMDFENFIMEQLEYTDQLLGMIRDAIQSLDINGIIQTIQNYTAPYSVNLSDYLTQQLEALKNPQKTEPISVVVTVADEREENLTTIKEEEKTEQKPEKKQEEKPEKKPGRMSVKKPTLKPAPSQEYQKGIKATDGKAPNYEVRKKAAEEAAKAKARAEAAAQLEAERQQREKYVNIQNQLKSASKQYGVTVDANGRRFQKTKESEILQSQYPQSKTINAYLKKNFNQSIINSEDMINFGRKAYQIFLQSFGESSFGIPSNPNNVLSYVEKQIKALENAGFSHGGIVDVVRRNGDDGLATLKVGEAVLTPVELNNVKQLTDSLGDMNFVMDSLHQLSNPTPSISTVNANKTVEIGEVNWNVSGTGIVDGDTFAKRMSNDPKFHRFMGDYVTDYFTGNGKSRRY